MRATVSSDESRSLRYLATLWIGGCAALGAVTATCVFLDQEESTTGFFLLVVIVLLSLLDSFISSVIFSVLGASLLSYFFTEPINSFHISKPQDSFSLFAFLVTSIAITTLVRRIGRVEKMQRAQAQLLELTHDIIIVRDKNNVITYWNQAAETLYGWKKEEAIGKSIDEFLNSVFPLPRDAAPADFSSRRPVGGRVNSHAAGRHQDNRDEPLGAAARRRGKAVGHA